MSASVDMGLGHMPAILMELAQERKDEKDENELERSPGLYKNDIPVSPILERTPSWSGTRWTRFFPEISSHFSLVSPTSSRHTSLDGALHQIEEQKRRSSDSGEISAPTTAPSSLWDELADDASSCYSRRSSITSLGSERSASAYKSADAFSIISPTRAGVFDETLSRAGSTASRMSKSPSDRSVHARSPSAQSLSIRSPTISSPSARSPSSKDKPLPCPPPIQMAPLSIRRKKQSKSPTTMTIREEKLNEILESAPGPEKHKHSHGHKNGHHPTLSQAAEELEHALAGLVEHKEAASPVPRIEVGGGFDLNAPLQISRGNMDMMPTRPAPSPPTHRKSRNSSSSSVEEIMKHAKKQPHKGRASFAFTVPGWRMSVRPRLRSLSSSNVSLGDQQKPVHAASEEQENAGQSAGRGDRLSAPEPIERPASASCERQLRLRLPRLRTKEVYLDSLLSDYAPRPRKAFSFEPEENTMPEPEPSEPPQPTGPFEMDVDSGPMVIYELDAGLPEHTIKTPVKPFLPPGQMPGTLPDEIVGMILRQCSQLQDLFSFAVMNRQFYRVFKAHELDLIKSTVFAMTPPAWELREMSPPWDSEWQVLFDLDAPVPEYTPSIYLDRYTRDLYTLVKLKSLILARCGTFLRPETVRGLAGQDDDRATEIDDAFWRVWTFCRIFGCGKGREGDVVGQLDWLRGGIMATSQQTSVTMSISEPFGMNNVLFEPPEGFGRGNSMGLSHSQLYDMTEIWTCLGVLLQPIHGKCAEARKAGVFEGHDAPEKESAKEEATLEEWTSYVLTLGPSAVLALGAIATVSNDREIFQRAQSLGLTKWEEADASRSSFFREAVSKAYKPRDQSPRKSPRLRQTGSNSSRSSASSNDPSPSNSVNNGKPEPLRRRQAAYAAQLRNRRANNADLSYVEERPISSYAEIMNRLAGAPPHPLYQQTQDPVPPLPTNLSTTSTSLSSSTQNSTSNTNPNPVGLGIANTNTNTNTLPPPTSPPTQTQIPRLDTHNIQIPYTAARPPRTARLPQQIRDPADQAIDMMVRELGFLEEDAKWALKITDTGEGINPNAAVSLLIQEYQRQNLQRSEIGTGTGMNGTGFGYQSLQVGQQGQGLAVYTPTPRNSVLSSVMHSQEAMGSGWRWA